LAVNCDMSAQWKMFGVGGAAKVHTFPCHCCPIKSDDLARPNAVQCNLCAEIHPDRRPNLNCYHQPMMTQEKMARTEIEFEELKSSLSGIFDEIDKIREDSIINQNQDPRAPSSNNRKDPFSIHFDYSSDDLTVNDIEQYGDRLEEDLAIRGEETGGAIAVLQKRLANLMIKEWTFLQLKDAVQHGEKLQNVVFMLLEAHAASCILKIAWG
jgi:hypothetical protein